MKLQATTKRRVVVTGVGIVSSIGIGKAAFAAALRNGQSGRVPIARFDTSDYPFRFAHEIRNFDFPSQKPADRVIEYARQAANEAIQDSGLPLSSIDPYRLAVSFSSSKGGVETLVDLLESENQPYFAARAASLFRGVFPDQVALRLAAEHGICGPVKSWIGACATGNLALADAYYLLADGYADVVLAGASDASIVPLFLAGYQQMKVLTSDQMRPFDEERSGFLVGEGSAAFTLEVFESARARGAHIYAEIGAVGMGQETSHPLFFDDEEGTLSRLMLQTVKKAEQKTTDIDYINLHGTATQHGDLYETREIKKAFGVHAYALSTSTIKPMTGHVLGASGAIEAAATLLAMEGGFVPPTLGLGKPDSECDLNYTAGKAEFKKIKTALSISMGFGGQAAAILLRQI